MNGIEQIRSINNTATAQAQADKVVARIAAEHGYTLSDDDVGTCFDLVAGIILGTEIQEGSRGLALATYGQRRAHHEKTTAVS